MRLANHKRGLLTALCVCAFVTPSFAQPRKKTPPVATPAPIGAAEKPVVGSEPADKSDKKGPAKKQEPKTFDFNALDLNGRMRTPQLLYFLERANEELERASLEKRSFIPHMVRSLDEEQL
jgi:hypothetical protein